MRSTLAVACLLATCGGLLGCDEPVAPVDGGEADAGPPTEEECDRDPLLPTCTPDEPPYDGLEEEVTILRDDMGIQHVYAESDADAMFASGYAQAVDRLFQMDLTLRRAEGRRAAILGEDLVSDDELVRMVDIARWGRTNAAATLRDEPEKYVLVQAWIAGVNRRIAEVLADSSLLPAEFETLGYEPEPWEVADAFSVGKLLLFGNANQLESEILTTVLDQFVDDGLGDRIGLMVPIRDSFTLPPEERPESPTATFAPTFGTPDPAPSDAEERLARFTETMRGVRSGGSNNWAISGEHTANGRPLIAGDPHQPLSSPSIFWAHHLNSADAGGNLDVIGFSFVGSPAVQLGHNANIAWTATTTYPDNMDIWDVKVSGGVVTVGDETVAIREREEVIEIAGQDARTITVEEVPGYGVLLPEDFLPLPIGRANRRILFNWTGFRPTHEFSGFYGIDTATSLDEFDAATGRMEIAYFNFLAADASGITYHVTPLVPDRGTPSYRPYRLIDGDAAETYWDGWLPESQLATSRGGERGWIATANNEIFGFAADGAIEGDPWYFGMLFDPGTRSARIESEIERLITEGDVTIDAMKVLQDDTHTMLADDFVPAIEEALAALETDDDPVLDTFRDRPELASFVARLAAWDRRMERDSSEAIAFNALCFFLARRVLADDTGLVFEPVLDASAAFVFKWLSNVLRGRAPDADSFFSTQGRTFDVLFALEETHDFLVARYGSADPATTWGDVHGTRFGSIYGERLEGGWIPTDGAEGTVNVSNTDFFDGADLPRERLDAGSGSIFRLVATFDEDGTPSAQVNFPRGVSGDPDSDHWDDLLGDWQENRYRPLLFRRAAVEAALDADGTTILAPE